MHAGHLHCTSRRVPVHPLRHADNRQILINRGRSPKVAFLSFPAYPAISIPNKQPIPFELQLDSLLDQSLNKRIKLLRLSFLQHRADHQVVPGIVALEGERDPNILQREERDEGYDIVAMEQGEKGNEEL